MYFVVYNRKLVCTTILPWEMDDFEKIPKASILKKLIWTFNKVYENDFALYLLLLGQVRWVRVHHNKPLWPV